MLPHGGVKQSGWVRFEMLQHLIKTDELTMLTGPLQRTMGTGGVPENQDRHLRRMIDLAPTNPNDNAHIDNAHDRKLYSVQISSLFVLCSVVFTPPNHVR